MLKVLLRAHITVSCRVIFPKLYPDLNIRILFTGLMFEKSGDYVHMARVDPNLFRAVPYISGATIGSRLQFKDSERTPLACVLASVSESGLRRRFPKPPFSCVRAIAYAPFEQEERLASAVYAKIFDIRSVQHSAPIQTARDDANAYYVAGTLPRKESDIQGLTVWPAITMKSMLIMFQFFLY